MPSEFVNIKLPPGLSRADYDRAAETLRALAMSIKVPVAMAEQLKRPIRLATVDKLGGIRQLKFAPGTAVDLRKLGYAQIVRISEVLWDDERQSFFVKFLTGELAGQRLTNELVFIAFGNVWPDSIKCNLKWSHSRDEARGSEWVVHFDEYEDAVAAEVAFVQRVRKAGIYKLA